MTRHHLRNVFPVLVVLGSACSGSVPSESKTAIDDVDGIDAGSDEDVTDEENDADDGTADGEDTDDGDDDGGEDLDSYEGDEAGALR